MTKIENKRELGELADEDTYRRNLLKIMKANHAHPDGGPVQLHFVASQQTSIDSNLQEEMQRFKELQPQKIENIAESITAKQAPHQQDSENNEFQELKKKPLLIASCNCGSTLVATMKERNEAEIKIFTYTVSGQLIETSYDNISNRSKEEYSPFPSRKEDYHY
jgi:hypothetical protein